MTIFLLPNLLSLDLTDLALLPKKTASIVANLNGLVAESEKSARRYLLAFLEKDKANALPVEILSEHTTNNELEKLILKIKEGGNWGVISDAGLPCLADPGANLVALAHKNKVEVMALSGPSSIMLAIMLSGFSAQQFTFHGYLPRDEKNLKEKLKEIEKSAKEYTQIFIEAPYRNEKMLSVMLSCLNKETMVCVAIGLDSSNQQIIIEKIKYLKMASFNKRPAIFLLRAP